METRSLQIEREALFDWICTRLDAGASVADLAHLINGARMVTGQGEDFQIHMDQQRAVN